MLHSLSTTVHVIADSIVCQLTILSSYNGLQIVVSSIVCQYTVLSLALGGVSIFV